MKEIKFRLIKNGKIVGYEKHILRPQCGEDRQNVICVCYLTPDEILDSEAYWKCSWYNKNDYIDHDTKDQFTGLKDKNGKDSYRLDIALDEFGQKWVMTWDDGNAGFCLILLGKTLENAEDEEVLMACAIKDMEIIGTVHDKDKK